MSAVDPFALGGRPCGDDAILALFREWRDKMERLAGHEEYEQELDLTIETQRQIYDAEASGLVGIAIKAFMLAYEVQEAEGPFVMGDHPCAINGFGQDQYGARRTLYLASHALRGLVIDAVRFLPELAPLAARIIAAPIVLPFAGAET